MIYIYIYIYEERKGRLKADPKHTGSIQEVSKGKNKKKRGYKKFTNPYLEPNQSKKLIKDKVPSSITDLVHDQKLHTKEFFIL